MPKDKTYIAEGPHDVNQIAITYNIAHDLIEEAISRVGRKRDKVYKKLVDMGFGVKVKEHGHKCTLTPPDPSIVAAPRLERGGGKFKPRPQPTPTPIPTEPTPVPVEPTPIEPLPVEPTPTPVEPTPEPIPEPIPTPTPVPEPTPEPTPVPVPPSAYTGCLYFNFNGKYMRDQNWNGGVGIQLAPSNMTIEQRKQALYLAQDAYAKYNVAVTDDVNVYNAAARRQEIVVTPTSSWYPILSYSGVAQIGSMFGPNQTPCFVFEDRLYTNAQYVGQIMVHESGHAIGLYHQSEYTQSCAFIQTYKPGCHMGSPFSVSQAAWIYQTCSGQDDNAILSQKLGLR